MKIVITARNFTNYDRAAFESLRACGHEVVDFSGRDFTIAAPEADMIAALSDAQAAICGLEPITEGAPSASSASAASAKRSPDVRRRSA